MKRTWHGSSDIAGTAKTAAPERVKVLLVDDQPENLLSAEAVLESLGEELVTATSGREALRHLLHDDFACILLDIMMPDMDGFETAALIRQRERSRTTPIIFVTALGRGDEHVLRGYGVGAVDYIVKPFVPEILRSKVAVFAELRRKTALLHRQSELLEERNAELEYAIERASFAEREISGLNRHLERQLTELAAVNRELEAFSYSVSHDLRAPLNRIAGFSKALLEFHASALDETARVYLQRIGDSASQMCLLVDDLLNFSRIARAELKRERVDLSGIVQAFAGELAARDPKRSVEFSIAPGISATGDSGLLRAVLVNLIENAWKFTRKHASARIEFGAVETPDERVYFIRDDGAGFDMEEASRLFRPFQRLHKSSDFEGTGIGLTSVERIIERHGGRIWAEAEVERGATFYFTLRQEEAE
jgi:signal transduction histidine kinase